MSTTIAALIKIMGDADSAVKEIDKLNGALDGVKKRAGSLGDAFKTAGKWLTGFGAVAGGATVALGIHGAKIQDTRDEYAKLAAEVGDSGNKMLAAMRVMTGGTIKDIDLMQNALRLTNLTGKELFTSLPLLMGIARQQAKRMGIDMSFALDSIITGFARGSALILDNLGITIDATAAYQTMANTLGVKAAALTKEQRIMAVLNAIQAKYGADVMKLAGAQLTAAESVQVINAQIANFKDRLGTALVPTVMKVSQLLGSLVSLLDKIPQPVLQSAVQFVALAAAVASVAGPLLLIGPTLASILPTVLAITGAIGALAFAWKRDLGGLQTTVRGWATYISSNWQRLVLDAVDWGFRLIENYGVGLVRGASAVLTGALNAVGNLIARFLRSASPPKEGVLTGILTWGKGLMNTYLQGMAQADFDILADATRMIEEGFRYLEGTGAIGEADVIPWVGEVREEVAGLLATFRETGVISEDALAQIAGQIGDMGAHLAEYLRLQLQHQQALQVLADAEAALTEAQARREAQNKKIDMLESLGVSPALIARMRERADAEVDGAEAAVDAAKAESDALAERAAQQQAYMQSLQDTNDLQTRQLQILEQIAAKAGGAGVSDVGLGGPSLDEALAGLDLSGAGAEMTSKIGEAISTAWDEILAKVDAKWNGPDGLKAKLTKPIQPVIDEFNKIKDRFTMSGGLEGLLAKAGKGFDTLKEKAQPVVDFFENNWLPLVAGVGTSLGIVLVGAIASVIFYLGTMAAAAVTTAATTIAAWLPVVGPIVAIGVAVGLLVKAWQSDFLGMRTTLTEFWETTAKPTFETVKAWLEVHIPAALAAVKSWWTTTWADIQTAFTTTKENVVGALTTIHTWFTVTLPTAASDLKTAFTDRFGEIKTAVGIWVGGVVGWFTTMKTQAMTTVSEWWTALSTEIGSWPGKMLTLGQDIVRGLINGLNSFVGDVAGTIQNLLGSIPGWAKKLLGIASPSTVMYDIGQDTGQGLVNGLSDTQLEVIATAQAIANAVASIFASLAQLTAGGGVRGLSDAARGTIAETLYGLLDLARGVAQALSGGMAGLGAGDALEGYATAQVLVETASKLAEGLSKLQGLDASKLRAFTGAQRGAIAEALYGLVDLLRGVAAALAPKVAADLGGGDLLEGYANLQAFVETASKGLEALAKLIEVVSAKIDPAEIDASAATLDLLKQALARWLRRLSDLAVAWRDKYGGDAELAWLTSFAEMTGKALDSLAKLIEAVSAKIDPAEIDASTATFDLLKQALARWLRRLSDLAVAWRTKYGDDTELAWVSSFAEMVGKALDPLSKLIEIVGTKINRGKLNSATSVFDLLKQVLARWLRRISDLAIAWRTKYGGKASLNWLTSFVEMVGKALDPLATLIDLSGKLRTLNAQIPASVYDDLGAALERILGVLEDVAADYKTADGKKTLARIQAVAEVLGPVGEMLSAIIEPFDEMGTFSWIPEPALNALQTNIGLVLTWLEDLVAEYFATDDAGDIVGGGKLLLNRINLVSEMVRLAMEAMAGAVSAMDDSAKAATPSTKKVEGVFGFIDTVVLKLKDLQSRLGTGIEGKLERLGQLTTFVEGVAGIVNTALSAIERLMESKYTGGLASDESLQGLVDAIVDIYDRFTLALSNMKIEIINFPGMDWYGTGVGLMQSLIAGLQSQMPNLSGTLSSIAAMVAGALTPTPVGALAGAGGGDTNFYWSPQYTQVASPSNLRADAKGLMAYYRLGRR